MGEGQQSLAEVKHELVDKIDAVDRKVDAVDRKVDAVDRKVDAVRGELVEKIDRVDRKVDTFRDELNEKIDAVEQRLTVKIDSTHIELVHLVSATATALEHHLDKKIDGIIDGIEERVTKAAEAAADTAVERVVGAVWERWTYDHGAVHDKIQALEGRLEEHLSNENIHLAPGRKR